MDSETAEMLVNTLSSNIGLILDVQNRVRAFELVFQEQNASLFEKYKATLENVRRNPPFSANPEGLVKLLSKLKESY